MDNENDCPARGRALAREGNIAASHRNAMLVVRVIPCVVINLSRYRNFLSLGFLRSYILCVLSGFPSIVLPATPADLSLGHYALRSRN